MNILSPFPDSALKRARGPKFSGLALVMTLGLGACGPDPSPTPEPEPEQPECFTGDDSLLELGTEVGTTFDEYEEGSSFNLEFASQSGMAGDLSLRAQGLVLSEVTEVRCRLLVDGEAIAESVTEGSSLDCDEGYARLNTSLPIDVGGHSTVNSVVQLEDRVGELSVVLSGEHGVIAEKRVNVLIRL